MIVAEGNVFHKSCRESLACVLGQISLRTPASIVSWSRQFDAGSLVCVHDRYVAGHKATQSPPFVVDHGTIGATLAMHIFHEDVGRRAVWPRCNRHAVEISYPFLFL